MEMRFTFLPFLLVSISFFACSEAGEVQPTTVETLDVSNSSSASRVFRGQLQHLHNSDTIVAYGFEWQSRYGNWKTLKKRNIRGGKFTIYDITPLSKWSSFTVRAFIETRKGFVYGNEVKFSTEDK
jgi:hypothetical protein